MAIEDRCLKLRLKGGRGALLLLLYQCPLHQKYFFSFNSNDLITMSIQLPLPPAFSLVQTTFKPAHLKNTVLIDFKNIT